MIISLNNHNSDSRYQSNQLNITFLITDNQMMQSNRSSTARILIACPDARGIVATVACFIADHGGNLLESDQHTDSEHGEFFMRVEFELKGCDLNKKNFANAWAEVSDKYQMKWDVYWSDDRKRMVILVGKQPHCLHDLIWRWQAGELNADIPMIISNHDTMKDIAEFAKIPFHHIPIENRDKTAQEEKIRSLLKEQNVDFVVLARYMQILSESFVNEYTQRIINIHHSFLPAFAGSDPYRQAYDRGVKIIGATSHYVTADLDAGPIIAQRVVRATHRDSVMDLRRRGRDLERVVLARAVRLHTEDKILVSKNKTVVFE